MVIDGSDRAAEMFVSVDGHTLRVIGTPSDFILSLWKGVLADCSATFRGRRLPGMAFSSPPHSDRESFEHNFHPPPPLI